jgi:hypothetical protein
MRAHRRSEGVTAPNTRPGELPGTDSGNAAELVRSRWHALRDAGRVEAGIAESVPVAVSPRVDNLLLLIAGVAGMVLAVALA